MIKNVAEKNDPQNLHIGQMIMQYTMCANF